MMLAAASLAVPLAGRASQQMAIAEEHLKADEDLSLRLAQITGSSARSAADHAEEATRLWKLALAEERAAATMESIPFLGYNVGRALKNISSGGETLQDALDDMQKGWRKDNARHQWRQDDGPLLLNAYRDKLQHRYGLASHLPPMDYPNYNLCGMCRAMFTLGKCTTPENASAQVISQLKHRFVELAKNTTFVDKLVNAVAGKVKILPYAARNLIKSRQRNAVTMGASAIAEQTLKCVDDSQVWWDTCSTLPCMRNMEGIDPSCKYRVAADGIPHDKWANVAGEDGSDPLGGSIEDASKHFLRSTKITTIPGGVADFTSLVTLQLGMHTFSSTYFHTHCGAGMDVRGISMGCHFPRKRWCTQLGVLAHYRSCKKMLCDSCLWTCKTKAEQLALGKIYPPSTSLVDTILPQECVQDVDRLEQNASFRRAICDDPGAHVR